MTSLTSSFIPIYFNQRIDSTNIKGRRFFGHCYVAFINVAASSQYHPPFFCVDMGITDSFTRRTIMTDEFKLEANWENFIKIFLSRLDIPTKEDIKQLHARLDKLEQLLYQGKPVIYNLGSDITGRRKSASSIVLDVIANHPKGTDFKTIKAATGFDDKKLRNIIFRLDKIERIVRVKRGIYKIA